MKTDHGSIFAALFILLSGVSPNTLAADIDKAACTFKGKKLYGKIQIVTSFPDVKVQEVTSFPDLKVEKVSSFPDKCGKWQLVTSFPGLP